MVCSSADVSSAWWEVCDDLEGPNFPIPAGFQVQATNRTCLPAELYLIPSIKPPYAAYVTVVHLFWHSCRTGSHQASLENFLLRTSST